MCSCDSNLFINAKPTTVLPNNVGNGVNEHALFVAVKLLQKRHFVCDADFALARRKVLSHWKQTFTFLSSLPTSVIWIPDFRQLGLIVSKQRLLIRL